MILITIKQKSKARNDSLYILEDTAAGITGVQILHASAFNQFLYACSIIVSLVFNFNYRMDRPVLDQNLYYTGMKYTSATFTSAMCNILPAITFVMAWILRYICWNPFTYIYMFIFTN